MLIPEFTLPFTSTCIFPLDKVLLEIYLSVTWNVAVAVFASKSIDEDISSISGLIKSTISSSPVPSGSSIPTVIVFELFPFPDLSITMFAGNAMLTGPLYSLYFPLSTLACSNPLITNRYSSPTLTLEPFLISVISCIFLNEVVKFSGTVFVSAILTTILDALDDIVELLKYLSVTEKSTVNVFASWSISVEEKLYIKSGLITSANNVFVVFLSVVASSILWSSLLPSDANSMFLFPYVSVNVPCGISILIFPLHSL